MIPIDRYGLSLFRIAAEVSRQWGEGFAGLLREKAEERHFGLSWEGLTAFTTPGRRQSASGRE